MNQILLNGLTVEELLQKIDQLIEAKLSKGNSIANAEKQTDLITRIDTAKLLSICLPTLNDWTKMGMLKSYKMGNRVYYKLNEVQDAISGVMVNKHKRMALK